MNAEELLSYKSTFDRYLAKGPQPLSAYHFSSIFAWGDYFTFSFEEIDGRLCVFAVQGAQEFLYLPPLGPSWDKPYLEKIMQRLAKSKIGRIENICDNQLPLVSGGYRIHLRGQEYIYRREALATLDGGDYKSQRHDANAFRRQYPSAVVRPFEKQDARAAVKLYEDWACDRRAQHADVIYQHMLDENRTVHERLLTYHQQLGLVGRVVELDKAIIGYTFGYPLNDDTFCVLLEITSMQERGLAAYIFQSFCKDEELLPFTYINTMDDFGMPQVARTKEAYHPCEKINVYNVKATL